MGLSAIFCGFYRNGAVFPDITGCRDYRYQRAQRHPGGGAGVLSGAHRHRCCVHYPLQSKLR